MARRRREPTLGDPRPRPGALDLALTREDRAVGAAGKRGSPRGEGRREPRLPHPGERLEKVEPVVAKPRPRPADRGRRARGARRWTLVRRVLYWGCVVAIWGLVGLAGLVAYYVAHLPPTSDWAVPKRPPNIRILAADGSLLANRGDTGGEALHLKDLPKHVIDAVLAIEDRRFYAHPGIDPIGLVRAVVVNATSGSVVQGGSTLTQQLAKNLFLTQERNFGRKIQEVALALWLEQTYGKDAILEMYLNRVYMGAGAYGVDAAARRYFGKSARQLSLLESAVLAGLLKAPSRFAPSRAPDLAKARAITVLAAMVEAGFINAEQRKAAEAQPLLVRGPNSGTENYVADWVMDLVPTFIGGIDRDIVVETTIDIHTQMLAEAALQKGIVDQGTARGVTQGALVAIDPTGAVRALVGGFDYEKSQFNRAIAAKRQPGSAFKPFVFLAAVESGLEPETVRVDEPVSIGGWKPQNYAKDYRGPMTLREALALSINTIAAKLAMEVGPNRVARVARRLGIASPLAANASIALGTSEVTPLEIAAAYVPFGNGGYGVVPHVIRRIRGLDGKVLYTRAGAGLGQVIQPRHLAMMTSMLAETLATGTGKRAQLPGWPAGGKTGTSQDFRDAWFIGYTARLTAAVWLGNDDGTPTKHATGGSLAAEIWRKFMTEAHAGLAPAPIPGGRAPPEPSAPLAAVPGAVAAPAPPPPPPSGPVPPAPLGPARPPGGRGLDDLLSRLLP